MWARADFQKIRARQDSETKSPFMPTTVEFRVEEVPKQSGFGEPQVLSEKRTQPRPDGDVEIRSTGGGGRYRPTLLTGQVKMREPRAIGIPSTGLASLSLFFCQVKGVLPEWTGQTKVRTGKVTKVHELRH